MDPIAEAIVGGWQYSETCRLKSQRWEEFEKAAAGKHIFVFGIGIGADFYFSKYREVTVEGIIDNNKLKHGTRLSRLITTELKGANKDLCVSDLSVLSKYTPDEVVVLITSLKRYGQIAEQLEEYGISRIFVLLLMEAEQRKGHAIITDETIAKYVRESCEKEIDSRKIVFKDQGSYCGHGKYITEQLLKVRNDLDIVWLVEDLSVKVPDGIRLVDISNERDFIYEMETAKVWVFDYWIPIYIEKRPGQIYVQVKHWASITLKTFGLDLAVFQKSRGNIYPNIHNGNIMDYIIIGSKFDEITCRKGFAFEGEVYKAGSPRSDALFRPIINREKINRIYSVGEECRLLLYAPTFRLEKDGTPVNDIRLDFDRIKQALEERFGGIWYILLRLHPNIAVKSCDVKIPKYVIDVSHYSDGQELAAASDIMVTDYSSFMFEPAFVKKPVFLFAPDKKEYINGERQLLIDYDTLPFPIAETNEELIQAIRKFNQEEYVDKVTDFLDQYDVHEDGHASERAAAFISELIVG